MTSLLESTNGVNGHSRTDLAKALTRKPKGRKPSKKLGSVATTNKARKVITVTMGLAIPLFSLAMSSTGGGLLQSGGSWEIALGVVFLGLLATVLFVSLSHLAWAIQDITRSSKGLSWCLAVAVDLALVACELSEVLHHSTPLIAAIMVGVTLMSMTLNVFAFMMHE